MQAGEGGEGGEGGKGGEGGEGGGGCVGVLSVSGLARTLCLIEDKIDKKSKAHAKVFPTQESDDTRESHI